MAVVEWAEASSAADLVASRGGRREWECPYRVRVDNPRDDAQTIVDFFDTIGRGLSMGLVYGDREDLTVFCKKIRPMRDPRSRYHWTVVLSYSPLDLTEPQDPNTGGGVNDDGEPTDDPLEYRWEISTGLQSTQEPVYSAWNYDPFPYQGDGVGFHRPVLTYGPVHNSAGIVLDPPLMRTRVDQIVRITGFVDQFHAALVGYNIEHVNECTLHWSSKLVNKYGFREETFYPYTIKCTGYGMQYYAASSWKVTLEFAIRDRSSSSTYGPLPALDQYELRDGWMETVLDRGITRIANAGAPDGAGSTISGGDIEVGMAEAAPIRDWQGERIPEMVLLNGHGQPLQGSNTLQAPPVYFRWIVNPRTDFATLPLPIFSQ